VSLTPADAMPFVGFEHGALVKRFIAGPRVLMQKA
jgi:hypothetical protein